MLWDKNLRFSTNYTTGEDLAQVVGNYLFTKSIPNGAADTPPLGSPLIADLGRASQLDILGVVTTAFTSGGAATLQFQVVQADDAALTANLEVLRETRALGYAGFTKGVRVNMGKIPPMSRANLGLRCVIGGATTTAGKMAAGLVRGTPTNCVSIF